MQWHNEQRDIQIFTEVLFAAGVGMDDGDHVRYKTTFLSYTEKDWWHVAKLYLHVQ